MPTQCDFTVGDAIAGKFRVNRCLGEGSFGKVYQVVDNMDNVYALKLLKMWEVPSHLQEKVLARFNMEYETGKIESPYLVHSYDTGIVHGNPYILMEFCPNGDLQGLPSSTDWNRIAHEVLYGLGSLHLNGKVHRDLKPENVLIKEDGTAALTDFGIAGDRKRRLTVTDGSGKPLQKFGTYAFMPPEQYRPTDKEVIVLPTTDIFSFGVMMFMLLTGELPYGPLNNQNDLVIYLNRGERGEWNRTALQGSPFYSAIEGCLIPDFRQRLQSVNDVLSLLPPYEGKSYQSGIFSSKKPSDGYLLRVMQGEEYGMTYDLTSMLQNMNFLTVGRADRFVNNDIAIKEEQSTYISRKHCTIEKEADGSLKIRDGQRDVYSTNGWRRSSNGTFVNSAEASDSGYYLRAGDIISIGDVKLRLEPYEVRSSRWATL